MSSICFALYHLLLLVTLVTSSRLRSSAPHVDVTKIWSEFDGTTGLQKNITINITQDSIAHTADTPVKVHHVDVTKIWSEFDGITGAQKNITSSADDPPRDAAAASTPTAITGYQPHTHQMKENVAKHYGNVGIVFLGDSTIAHINRNETFWAVLETKYHALNLAIPGEHTENLLYRLQNTDLSDIKNAHLVVILIGTLNIGAKDSAEAVKNGISAIVTQASKIFSIETSIAILGILPRFSTRLNIAINATNALLADLYRPVPDRPDIHKNIKFIDLSFYFLEANNPSGLREEYYMPDLLHPNTKGYQQVISSLLPEINRWYNDTSP